MHRHAVEYSTYPRGPRSGPGCSVPVRHHLIGPIRPTRRHIAISPAYTRCLRCAGAPRRPASGSGLSLPIPSWHAVLSDPGEFDIDIFPRASMPTWPSPPYYRLGTPDIPAIRSTRVFHFVASLVRFRYGLPGCLPPCTDQTGPSSPRGLLLPGFQQVGLPPCCWIYLQQ